VLVVDGGEAQKFGASDSTLIDRMLPNIYWTVQPPLGLPRMTSQPPDGFFMISQPPDGLAWTEQPPLGLAWTEQPPLGLAWIWQPPLGLA